MFLENRPSCTQSDYTIISKWTQSDPKSLLYAKNDPKSTPNVTRTVRPETFFGAGTAPLTFKICRRNEYKLLMGPFGSDQSRHVDDFGEKKAILMILLRKSRRFNDCLSAKIRMLMICVTP